MLASYGISASLSGRNAVLASKGVQSVSSRITNISQYLPADVTLDDFKHRLLAQIAKAEAPYRPRCFIHGGAEHRRHGGLQ